MPEEKNSFGDDDKKWWMGAETAAIDTRPSSRFVLIVIRQCWAPFFSSSFHFYTFFRLASCCCSVELILQDFSLILRLSISVIYCLKNDVTAYSALAVQRTSYLWGCCKLDLLQVQAIIALLKTRLAKTSAKQRNLIIIPPRLFIYTWSIPALQ